MLLTGGKEIVWYLGFGKREMHLQIENPETNIVEIRFDTTAFYDDLVAVCEGAIGKYSDGTICSRYNAWLQLDLDVNRHKAAINASINEISAL